MVWVLFRLPAVLMLSLLPASKLRSTEKSSFKSIDKLFPAANLPRLSSDWLCSETSFATILPSVLSIRSVFAWLSWIFKAWFAAISPSWLFRLPEIAKSASLTDCNLPERLSNWLAVIFNCWAAVNSPCRLSTVLVWISVVCAVIFAFALFNTSPNTANLFTVNSAVLFKPLFAVKSTPPLAFRLPELFSACLVLRLPVAKVCATLKPLTVVTLPKPVTLLGAFCVGTDVPLAPTLLPVAKLLSASG